MSRRHRPAPPIEVVGEKSQEDSVEHVQTRSGGRKRKAEEAPQPDQAKTRKRARHDAPIEVHEEKEEKPSSPPPSSSSSSSSSHPRTRGRAPPPPPLAPAPPLPAEPILLEEDPHSHPPPSSPPLSSPSSRPLLNIDLSPFLSLFGGSRAPPPSSSSSSAPLSSPPGAPPSSSEAPNQAGRIVFHFVDLTNPNAQPPPAPVDLTHEETPRQAPPRDDDEPVVLRSTPGQAPPPAIRRDALGSVLLSSMIVLDALLHHRQEQPQAQPLDVSGGYWARRRREEELRRAGKNEKDPLVLDEDGKKEKKKVKDGEGEEEPEPGSYSNTTGSDGAFPGKNCAVCLSPITDVTAAVCGHVFCEGCLLGAIHHQGKCPTCRRKLTVKDIHPLFL